MDTQAVIQAFIEAVEFETGMLLRSDEVRLSETPGKVHILAFGEEIAATEPAEKDADTAQALFEEISNPRETVAAARLPLLLPALEEARPLLLRVMQESGITDQMDIQPEPELGIWDGLGFHWETDTEASTGWPNMGVVMENLIEDFDFRFAFNIHAPEQAFDRDELEAELRAYCADWMA